MNDKLDACDRVYLDKLRLAAEVLIRGGEEAEVNSALESELVLLRDRLERALLRSPAAP
ncbi:MAG: hypothetical protein FWE35_17540 [Streptosporangiales bacterium]|nr:hypothetical protein [Streptosporangiales bacterium]